ncbi:hypothetical protein L195_g048612, partial [Trifolium pratense]
VVATEDVSSKADKTFDPVKKVTNKMEIWRLGVLLDDMWIVYKGESEDHVDLLLRDVKGDIIQATIMQNDIKKWKSKLTQGKTYYMHNFRVVVNDSAYKMTPHKFKLTFVGATMVDEEDIPGIPFTAFNFKDFAEIQSGKYVPNQCVSK